MFVKLSQQSHVNLQINQAVHQALSQLIKVLPTVH